MPLLYCIIPYYNVMFCTISYSTVLYYILLYCTVVYCVVLYYIVLYLAVLYFIVSTVQYNTVERLTVAALYQILVCCSAEHIWSYFYQNEAAFVDYILVLARTEIIEREK